jgi:Protein of unknown function (DUF3237)
MTHRQGHVMNTPDVPTPTLERLFRAEIRLGPVQQIGATPLGGRRIFPITGGTFTGQLEGEVLPGGADWQIVAGDGTLLLDARYTLRTNDGALILVQNKGVRHGPPEVLERLLRGETVDPSEYYFRTTPTLETGATQYAWLNSLIFVCAAVRGVNTVILDFYAVR